MAGHRKFETLTKQLDARPDATERRANAKGEMNKQIADYEATMVELRRARAYTQATLAEAIGTSQGEVSRIEHQADLYLSTLARYIEAMGGELDLVARFDDGQRVAIRLPELTAA